MRYVVLEQDGEVNISIGVCKPELYADDFITLVYQNCELSSSRIWTH